MGMHSITPLERMSLYSTIHTLSPNIEPYEERNHTSVAVVRINKEHLPGNKLGDVYILQLALVHCVAVLCYTREPPPGYSALCAAVLCYTREHPPLAIVHSV